MADESAKKAAFVDRVAAAAVSVRPAKLLLTLLALPFYVLGWVLGLVYVCVLFAVGACKVGIADARSKASPASVRGDG